MRSVVFSIALLAAGTPAAAYDTQQENVLNNFAMALAISKKCPRLVIDEKVAALGMIHYRLNKNDLGEVRARAENVIQQLSDRKIWDICDMGATLFGTTGTQVPGALKVNRPPHAVRRARFHAFAIATEEKCPQYVVQTDAVMTSDMTPDDSFIVDGLIDEEQPKAEEALKTMSCKQAVAATLKLTKLKRDQVFEVRPAD